MNVTQLINNRGNAAANQFVITTDKGQYFKSYDSLIAFKPRCGSTPVITGDWDGSSTTLKHLKIFLGTSASKKELEQMIKSGSIILDNNLSIC